MTRVVHSSNETSRHRFWPLANPASAPSLRVFSSLRSPSDDLLFNFAFIISAFICFLLDFSFSFTFVLYLLNFLVLQVSVTNDADLQFILIEYLATDHSLLVIPPCFPAHKRLLASRHFLLIRVRTSHD